jgi:hypothetical protein
VTAEANLAADRPHAGAIALLAGVTPFVVYANGSAEAHFRRYDGSGPLHDVVNWRPAVDIGYADSRRWPAARSGCSCSPARRPTR